MVATKVLAVIDVAAVVLERQYYSEYVGSGGGVDGGNNSGVAMVMAVVRLATVMEYVEEVGDLVIKVVMEYVIVVAVAATVWNGGSNNGGVFIKS